TSTSIVGSVTDPSGAVVSGAVVTASNVKTGIQTRTVTTASGDYTIPLLDVGEYELTAQAPGFRVERRQGIRLQINDKLRVDFELQVGSQTETVSVTAEAA